MSAVTTEGSSELLKAMESALSSQMEYISCTISYDHVTLLSTIHNLGILDEVQYLDEGAFVRGKVPLFLKEQIENRGLYDEEDDEEEYSDPFGFKLPKSETAAGEQKDEDFDWSGLAKGRHSARREWDKAEGDVSSDSLFRSTEGDALPVGAAAGSVGHRESYSALGGHRQLVMSSSDTGSEVKCDAPQSLRKRKVSTTAANRRKASEADGDEFNDTSKLLDFDAGDYYGSFSTSTEENTEDSDE